MDFVELSREGSRPEIVPNAGLRRTLCWTNADCGRYGELLKAAYPGIVFYEDFGHCSHLAERPVVRFLNRLDEPDVKRQVGAFVPYSGWRPDLVRETYRNPPHSKFWTWAHYLSPRISIDLFPDIVPRRRGWHSNTESGTIENWSDRDITTSYRRQIRAEASIQAKVVRLVDKLCKKAVLVTWDSEADFVARRGRIWGRGKQLGIRHVTTAVLDWYRAAPARTIGLHVAPAGWAMSYLPVEDIPEDWWEGFRRPKWAQRP
jgi:hypothetical protein